ncbi:MAG TPA: hypothetical protein VFT31_00885 [Kribbella sp.]|nr:hypothetical protein [Kribbella sp.]
MAADGDELLRLRALLFETLGGDFFNPSTAGDGWRTVGFTNHPDPALSWHP